MRKANSLLFKRRFIAVLVVPLLILAACGGSPSTGITPTATSTVGTMHTANPTIIASKTTSTPTGTVITTHPTGFEDFSEEHPAWDNSEGFEPIRVKNPFGSGWALKVTAPLQLGSHPQSETKSYPFKYGGLPSGIGVKADGTMDLTGYQLIIQAEFDSSATFDTLSLLHFLASFCA